MMSSLSHSIIHIHVTSDNKNPDFLTVLYYLMEGRGSLQFSEMVTEILNMHFDEMQVGKT